LIVAVAGSFVTPFMGSAINVALPSIGEQFQMDAVLLSWIATSYLLAAAAFLVPLGKLADIHGRKRTYTYGMILFTVASLLCAAADSPAMLILFRVLQGIGAAMIFSTGMAILTSVFPPEERGTALGITVAAVYIGLSVGPFVGGWLTQHYSWRAVFLFNGPFGIVTVVLILMKLKEEWAEAASDKFDLVGSFVYVICLTTLMYGLSLVPAAGSVWLFLVAACAAAVFIRREASLENPVLDLSLFRSNRVFAFSSLAALLNYSATFAVTFLLSIYLQHVNGLSPEDAGLVLMTQPAVMAAFSPLAGRLSDRIEPRIVASAGMALTAVGLLSLSMLREESTLAYIILDLVVLGLGFALFSSPNMNAIMSSVNKGFYGIASGALGTMRLLGQMLSMGIATLVFALFVGRVQIAAVDHPSLLKSCRYAFLAFSALCFAGILASLVRGRLRDADS